MSEEDLFYGHEKRDCGEHRTVGHRAWCFECSEWCYPRIPCKGCENPALRSALADLLDTIERGDEYMVRERCQTAGKLLGLERYQASS